MYTIVEIDKTSQYFGAFTPYAPYVFSTIVKYDTAGTYWVDNFGSGEDSQPNDLNITSVTLQSIHDVEKMDTLSDCLGAENSFWFDFDNQVLYVHFPHVWTPEIVDVLIGRAWGYCSDTVRYLRNQLYRPLVKSIPQMGDEIDPLQYGIMAFGGGTVVLANGGEFDQDLRLYGNAVRIKRGKEGDSYDDLRLMFSGYIRDYTITTSEIELDCADKRERLQTEWPNRTVDVLDKYVKEKGWETKQVLLPDGYGDVIQVPAYPVQDLGAVSYSVELNGVNSYIRIPKHVDLRPADEIRIELNAYMSDWNFPGGYSKSIIDCTDSSGWRIALDSDGVSFYLMVLSDSLYKIVTAGYNNFNPGWNDIIATFNGLNMSIEINGVLIQQLSFGSTQSIKYKPLDILFGADINGSDNPISGTYWRGLIGRTKLYSDAAGTALIAEWAMNEGAGLTVADSAGGHDGTLVNATWAAQSGILYKWGEAVNSVDKVFVVGDVLEEITPSSFDTDGGIICDYVDVARDGADPTNGLKQVVVSGRMRDIDNPAEIIIDLNKRIYNVVYNNSNYNIAELEAEKALLAPVGLYMGEAKKVYEWIELLQNGTNYGFRYEDSEKRTIRLDLPTRPTVLNVTPLDIRNADMPVNRNAELYASSCLVKYAKNWRSDSWQQVENKKYETEVINEHRIKKVQQYESLLVAQADAEEKAEIVMSDIHVVRPIVTLRLDSSLYPAPRVFDMITATVSLIEGNEPQPIDWPYVLGGVYVLGDELVLGSKSSASLTPSGERCRVYLGAITGQVIGIEWLTETDEIEINVRVK